LPARFAKHIHLLERYGPIVLIGLIISSQFTGFSILGQLIWPFVDFFFSATSLREFDRAEGFSPESNLHELSTRISLRRIHHSCLCGYRPCGCKCRCT
jgi:hypothetical protein